MTEYKDIETDCNMTVCHLCKKDLSKISSPWSICYDPYYKENIWGGDSHEYRALLCQDCAEKLLKGEILNTDLVKALKDTHHQKWHSRHDSMPDNTHGRKMLIRFKDGSLGFATGRQIHEDKTISLWRER